MKFKGKARCDFKGSSPTPADASLRNQERQLKNSDIFTLSITAVSMSYSRLEASSTKKFLLLGGSPMVADGTIRSGPANRVRLPLQSLLQ